MRALRYSFKEAVVSLWRRRRSSALSVATITVESLVLGILLTASWNLDGLLAQWAASAEMSVYLGDDVTPEARAAVEQMLRGVGLVFVCVLVMAAALTVANVVRLARVARSDEIEIMRLVGAPLAYVRGPFVLEGILQGGVGASVALALLVAGLFAGESLYGDVVRQVLGADVMSFLPPVLGALLVFGGMAVGCVGGLVASLSTRETRTSE